MTTTMIIADMIKVSISSVVFSRTSNAVGQKNIGDIIRACGWVCIGLDMFLLVKPLIDFTIKFGQDIAMWSERIASAFSWLGM